MKKFRFLSVAEWLVIAVVVLNIGRAVVYDSATVTRRRLARMEKRARAITATNMAALREEMAAVADADAGGGARRRRPSFALDVLRIDGAEFLLPADRLSDYE